MNLGPAEIGAIVAIVIVLFLGLRKGKSMHHLSPIENAYRKMVGHSFFRPFK